MLLRLLFKALEWVVALYVRMITLILAELLRATISLVSYTIRQFSDRHLRRRGTPRSVTPQETPRSTPAPRRGGAKRRNARV